MENKAKRGNDLSAQGAFAKKRRTSIFVIESSSEDSDSDSDSDCMILDDRTVNSSSSSSSSSSNSIQDDESDDEDVVMIVPKPKKAPIAAAETQNDDDEIQIIGSTGKNALSDFPHARFNCVNFIFNQGPVKYCDQCYCYVCDTLASTCQNWSNHCQANHEHASWRQQRKQARAKKNAPANASSSSSSSLSSSSSSSAVSQYRYSFYGRSAASSNLQSSLLKRVMEACQQIYPMELQEPSGLIASCRLRTYQKQSLAFMVNREQGKHDPDYVESSILGRKLFRRQKGKSDYEHRFSGIKTGMLCSEVGMGKTLVCIALICANPGSYKRISDAKFAIATAALKTRDYSKDNKQHNARICKQVAEQDLATAKYKIKTTVISTTNTIVGQWYDEIKKFAPSLNVKVHHGSYKSSPDFFNPAAKPSDIQDIDILLTVNTTAPPPFTLRLTFHRVIVDEVHQYFLPYYHAKRLWGVTATPFEKLQNIFMKFGEMGSGMNLGTKWRTQQRNNNALYEPFIDAMNTFMIRHTKSQEIQGQAALKLPPMPKSSIDVTLSASELKKYLAGRSKLSLSTSPNSLTAVGIDQQLHYIRSATCCQSKLEAFGKDYSALLAVNPSASVVVFSCFSESIDALKEFTKKTLNGKNIKGYWLKPNTAAKSRHKAIREFQDESNTKPKILAISYKTGQCGITLTAASRVYLLEPCLLPSDEVQAAGRISRLGQTKEISLVRLVAKNTCDEAILKMHGQLASGARKFTESGNLPFVFIADMLKIGSDSPPPVTFQSNVDASCGPYQLGWEHGDAAVVLNAKERRMLFNNPTQSKLMSKLQELFKIQIDHARDNFKIDATIRYDEYRPDTYKTISSMFNNLGKRLTTRMSSDYLISSNFGNHACWAALYGKNPMEQYTEEYTEYSAYYGNQTKYRCNVTFDFHTDRADIVKYLEDVARYGTVEQCGRIARKYKEVLRN